ncbi:hypothetical protein AGMMS49990_09010 [Endomicrobiia bacterium]|nr:hypothetical protein AGMMS49990_09010 [Endomicrobiia bacterium]
MKWDAEIFKTIVPEVVRYSPKALILVVTNPVGILSYVTYKVFRKTVT